MLTLLTLLTACNLDQGLFLYAVDDSSSGDTADTADTAEVEADTDTDTDTDTDSDTDTDTDTDTDAGPRPPSPGDLVISELMIDPSGVSDSVGEWVELVNVTEDSLDLSDLTLGDEGVDFYLLKMTGLVLSPGGYLVLCASADAAENGGVSCGGEYLYQSFGGGFALANGGDEVVVGLYGGPSIDTVRYGESVAPVGGSLGVSPGCLSASDNDRAGCWCAQGGQLSSGDAGNPGKPNDGC
ncbi:MAG: hypothetical protein ACI8S6_000563 [Myxococcota bacterium]|jgi:hypothetical protein